MIVAIWLPGRPVVLNAERREHWRDHRENTRQSRGDATTLARAARFPKLWHGYIVATPSVVHPLPDPGNNYPTVKAALDGLVDAGVLPDDKFPHVRGILMLPPLLALNRLHEGLVIAVNELAPSPTCPICAWSLIASDGEPETTAVNSNVYGARCECPYPEVTP